MTNFNTPARSEHLFPYGLSSSLFLVLLFVFSAYAQAAGPAEGPADGSFPDLNRLRQHLYFLSSDELKGRGTGTAEIDVAARYISSRFRNWELEPFSSKSDGGSYFQTVPLEKSSHRATITVADSSDRSSFRIEAPLIERRSVNTPGDRSGRPVVFAGYGISDEERGYNDYENVDVDGKYVVVFRHEPNESDPDSKFDGTSWTEGAYFHQKYRLAEKRGAAGIILINDPLGEHDGFPDVVGRSRWMLSEQSIEFENGTGSIPFVALSPSQGARLLGMGITELRTLQKKIDRTLTPQSFELQHLRISINVEKQTEIRSSARNVIGLVPGTNRGRKNGHVVVGAHYDHLGTADGGKDRIYNGADDNASGTAAVLELARGFATDEFRPERTMIFILFTGEEKGLLGSRYYRSNPPVPLRKTVAMINFDMVGRSDGTVSVFGASEYPVLERLTGVYDRTLPGFTFETGPPPGNALSDHRPFSRENIPFLFYFTGFHDDYHGVNDEVDKLNVNGLRAIVQHASGVLSRLGSGGVKPGNEGNGVMMETDPRTIVK